MKLGFVFQKDSHLKAVQATALRLGRQYQDADVCFYSVNADIQIQQPDHLNIVHLNIQTLQMMQECDYLICCLGGYLLNKVVRQFTGTDTKIISLFPGVVSHYQLDAFISRFNADQVWLNCRADYEFYAKLCQVFGVRNNGVLYGASWFNELHCSSKHTTPSTIFFEQTQVILDDKMAWQVQNQLTDIIQQTPTKPFIYKLRQNIHNNHLGQIRQALSTFNNVVMRDELSDDEICQADTYLSISSSAIFEGLLLGKQCYLLSQSYLDKDTKEIFGNSQIFLDKPNQSLNDDWFDDRVCLPILHEIRHITKNQAFAHFSKRSFGRIAVWVMCMVAYYPKLWRIATIKGRDRAIQKSLEYVSAYD